MNVGEQKILRQLINKISEEQQNSHTLLDCTQFCSETGIQGHNTGNTNDPRLQFPGVSSTGSHQINCSLATAVHNNNTGETDIHGSSQANDLHLQFSGVSSTGSSHQISCSLATSAHNNSNTDDEDSDGIYKLPVSYKERRREAHSQAEQKRRDAIKKGYEELTLLVPTCQVTDNVNASKFSKATILQKAYEYIQWLLLQNKKQQEEIDNLRKELEALKIMKENYEKIVIVHKKTAVNGAHQVPENIKFQVFQQLMDCLFNTFNASIMVDNFTSLSGSIFSWLEEHCKPQFLKEFAGQLLGQITN